MPQQIEFGYLPKTVEIKVGDLSIRTLPDLAKTESEVTASGLIEKNWYYAPPAQVRNMFTDEVRTLPFSSRVFDLPKTHILSHASSKDPEHLRFLVWMLGFIYGIRLSADQAGFLDATPIKTGTLTDICWTHKSDQKAIELADVFWTRHLANPRVANGLTGIIHCLFLSQFPELLSFEVFIYLYIAFDGCFALWNQITRKKPKGVKHGARIAYLCAEFGRSVPKWADKKSGVIADIRNFTLHEGLFFDKPLGFQIFGGQAQPNTGYQNILLEMRVLACRFICAIAGFNSTKYIESAVDTRQIFGVQL